MDGAKAVLMLRTRLASKYKRSVFRDMDLSTLQRIDAVASSPAFRPGMKTEMKMACRTLLLGLLEDEGAKKGLANKHHAREVEALIEAIADEMGVL